MRAALLAVALVLGGCRSAAFTLAEHKDTEDGWRAYLADHDVGAEADAARDRLDDRVWADVEKAHTRLAYRRYLDEYPDGTHSEEALDRLRMLRNHRGSGDAADLDATDGPGGAPGAAAAALAASAGGDPTPLRVYLARFPDSPSAAELKVREDDLSFAQASRGDGNALRSYLEQHPNARHREEVATLIDGRQVRALLWEERFVDADERLHALPAGPVAQRLRQELCERQARAARANAGALADLGNEGLALVLADDGAVLALSRGLASEEAVEVIEAAWALADTGAPAALDPLLSALGPERSLAVRWTARLALARLIEGWPAEVRELELEVRRERIASRAASAPLWIEEAVLEEGLGLEEAQVTLAKARHDAPEDPMPLAVSLQRTDLRDPERSLVAQQLDAALATVPTAEGCARQWLGRLVLGRPAEAGGPCPEGPSAASSTAQARRLAAVATLVKRTPLPPALVAQLGRLAERDGSVEVRAAARAALSGADTLATPACAATTALLESPGP